jgi:hypothetical protein
MESRAAEGSERAARAAAPARAAPGAALGARRALRVAAPLAWLAATVAFVAVEGLPLTRDWIAGWVLLGVLALSVSDVGGWLRGVVVDWLPFFGLLALYDLARGAADGLLFEPFFLPQIDADRLLFGGAVPSTWLQERLYEPGALPWWAVVCWAVYLSHFFATPLLAGVLWKLDRARFRRFACSVGALAVLGCATYALFPAAPPWLAAEHGLIGETVRVIPEIWGQLGVPATFGALGTGYEYANDVAAVPSLHAAYSLLIVLELWPRGRWRRPAARAAVRALLVAYPLVMGFALVYGGEHYVVDLLLGWGYAVVAFAGVRAAFARRARRRARDAA